MKIKQKVRMFAVGTVLAATAIFPQAKAAILVDLIDAPAGAAPTFSFNYLATTSEAVLSFAGYQESGFELATDISFVISGSSVNLIGATWNETFAPSGSLAAQIGTLLIFGGTSIGSYDVFTQTIATQIGTSYELTFNYQNDSDFPAPSGFRVNLEAAQPAVPEPSTWAMIILGFASVSYLSYRRSRKQVTSLTGGQAHVLRTAAAKI